MKQRKTEIKSQRNKTERERQKERGNKKDRE